MVTAIRLYVRTGIVGAWAVFFGLAILVAAERVLSAFKPDDTGQMALATAGLPTLAAIHRIFEGLYDGGAATVLVGIVLVFAGWYQLLKLA